MSDFVSSKKEKETQPSCGSAKAESPEGLVREAREVRDLLVNDEWRLPRDVPGLLDRLCAALTRAPAEPLGEWDTKRWGYSTLFNAIAAAVKIQPSNAIGISVRKFEEAMLAAAPAAPRDGEPKQVRPFEDVPSLHHVVTEHFAQSAPARPAPEALVEEARQVAEVAMRESGGTNVLARAYLSLVAALTPPARKATDEDAKMFDAALAKTATVVHDGELGEPQAGTGEKR